MNMNQLPNEMICIIYQFNPEHRPQWNKVMNSLIYHFKDKMIFESDRIRNHIFHNIEYDNHIQLLI